MAIYHLSSQIFTRSKSQSSVGKSAYRSAEKIKDERLDKTFDYTNKSDLFHKEIMLCKDAPERYSDRKTLWNEVEVKEKRKDAQVAREVSFSLPKELTDEQNIKLAKEYVKTQFVDKGMIADLCFHKGHGRDQPHVHVMLTMREISGDGFGQKVVDWNKRHHLYKWREEWANYANKHLAKAGFDIKIDHRSNIERGIDLEPQKKIGANGARERLSEKVLEHQEIARRNGDRIYNDPSIAIDALTKYKSTFTDIDIAKFVSRHTENKEQFDKVYFKVKAHKELINLGLDDRNNTRYSSQEMIDIEYRMVRQSQSLSESDNHRVNLNYREELISKYSLSDTQSEAFRHITGDRDAACVVGYAGSGKSYMLSSAKDVWEKAGYNVMGATLSGIASENLESDSGIKSYTVANRIINWDNDRERLKKNDIIVIDEAGMLGSRDIAKITDEATLAGSKVVLIGDPQQLQSIEAGAAFRGVIERIGHVNLNEIRRQKESWQQDATKSLALGEIGDAIAMYRKKDMVHEFEDGSSAKEQMVNDWHESVLNDKSSIMLAYTRDDVKQLNARAREVRKSYDELGIEANYSTEKGKRDFAIGDRIYFLKNDKELGVKNGTLGTISSLYSYTFEIELDKGGDIKFDIRDYNNIDHGYASTIHKSQGITVDKAFVLPSKYMNRHSTYVALSRHRQSVDVYWSNDKFSDYEKMIKILSRINQKDLTSDYSILEEDYKDNAYIFAGNKSIDLKHTKLKDYDNLEDFSHHSQVMDFAKDLKKAFQYSYVDYKLEDADVATYMGNVKFSNKEFAIVEQNGIGGCLLKNVNTSHLSAGDEVKVDCKVDAKGIEKLSLNKDLSIDIDDEKYEISKAQSDLSSISRKLRSKETHYIESGITTKDIYKSLYEKLPSFLPEFGFKKMSGYYLSTTGHKTDGSQGKKEKVYVYQNNPGLLIDYTKGNKSIWDYVSESSSLNEKKDIFQYLADAAGIGHYFNERFEILKEDRKAISSYEKTIGKDLNIAIDVAKDGISEQKSSPKIPSELWDKVYAYSLDKMEVQNNQISKYLTNTRGYSDKVIKDCGIGYIPNKKQLITELESLGVIKDQAQSQDLQEALGCIGYSHKMIMPFYDKSGKIMGLSARNIKYTPESKFSKYAYSKGLSKSSTMIGIEHVDTQNPIIIVEGILDALRAKADGIDNVVALGGSGMNIKQLELINDLGIQEVRLCLDNDKTGIESTKNIALQINDKNPDIEIKCISMPKGIKDLDQLISEKGDAKINTVMNSAKEIDTYSLQEEREVKSMSKFQKEHVDGYGYEMTILKR